MLILSQSLPTQTIAREYDAPCCAATFTCEHRIPVTRMARALRSNRTDHMRGQGGAGDDMLSTLAVHRRCLARAPLAGVTLGR
jgi:hypothetical protein